VCVEQAPDTMRALLLSDIHANIDALEAVIEAAPAHDVVWNLGDVVGYGAAPNEVIERVRDLAKLLSGAITTAPAAGNYRWRILIP